MKTIIEKDTRISKYLFEDSAEIVMEDTIIITPNFVIGDMNKNNAEIIENVESPVEWIGCKYIFTEEGEWIDNPDYVEQNEEELV